MSAVCVRCGTLRDGFRQVCPSCGHRPEAEGLLISWLLSSDNLDQAGLERVSERVRAGESIRPSDRMLDRARKALKSDLANDPGLPMRQLLALLAVGLLLTPLPGWVLWFWWRRERPRAALQALALSLPSSLLYTLGVLAALLLPR